MDLWGWGHDAEGALGVAEGGECRDERRRSSASEVGTDDGTAKTKTKTKQKSVILAGQSRAPPFRHGARAGRARVAGTTRPKDAAGSRQDSCSTGRCFLQPVPLEENLFRTVS